jgi:flagellar hook-associated protein 1
VDINEEVARLMELQNAYAANARVASVVQELLDTLMQSFR